MKIPKLSIIVPVYNVEKYLKDCLNSLLCQSVNGGYEIICVNDGSKDSSQQILDEYSQSYPEIIKVFNKKMAEFPVLEISEYLKPRAIMLPLLIRMIIFCLTL